MDNWDDLRVFLAAARGGSSRAAAEALGINQSTVSRRMRSLEERAGVRLLDRSSTGFSLTEAGAELLELAEGMERAVSEVERRLHGRDLELEGSVRLSLPDFLLSGVAAHLASFATDYPRIEVELIVDNGFVNLTRREADLALRLAASPPEHLVGRRVASLAMAVYGAAGYVDALRVRGAVEDQLRAAAWVRWDEPWQGSPPERWIDAHAPGAPIRSRVNTSAAHSELLAAGLGLGIAPCFSGDTDPRLVRLVDGEGASLEFGFGLWILTHADLRTTARVRALMRHLGDALAAQRPRFAGTHDG